MISFYRKEEKRIAKSSLFVVASNQSSANSVQILYALHFRFGFYSQEQVINMSIFVGIVSTWDICQNKNIAVNEIVSSFDRSIINGTYFNNYQ